MLKWLKGYVVCTSCHGSWERFMNMCRHHKINLWKIKREQNICFSLSADDFKKILPIARKSGILPHIKSKKGFPFLVQEVIRSWTFYSGFIIFFLFLSFLSSFVWEIQFFGQSSYTKETLLKTINSMGICRGMRRRHLICDEIEKNLRERYSDISWVSAEEKGSLLKISVKEAEKETEREKNGRPCHLVTKYSGVVKKISTNRGMATVKPGQRVKKGEVLISGILPITSDDEQIVEKIPVVAKGEVELYVEQDIEKIIPEEIEKKDYTGNIIKKYEYQCGDYSIKIKNPIKRFNKSCKYDIITTVSAEKKIQPFPFFLQKRIYDYREYRQVTKKRTKKEIQRAAQEICRRYLRKLKENGVEPLTHTAEITKEENNDWKLKCHVCFLCRSTTPKYIAENEWQVKKEADGENHG